MKTIKLFSIYGLLLVALTSMAVGCAGDSEQASESKASALSVVVTTSMIESAALDVGGEHFNIVRLVPPHSCPGHFDATPAQLEAISAASIFIRHDYQGHLDRKISDSGKAAGNTLVIKSQGPQTIPENYIEVCRVVKEALAELRPDIANSLELQYRRIEEDVQGLESYLLERYAGDLAGRVVVVSKLQENFCKWLGLEIAATFDNADQASLRGVQTAVSKAKDGNAEAVVANLQRGLREAESLAEKLDIPVVVLSNFPELEGKPSGYTGLLGSNIRALHSALIEHE